MRFMHRLFPYWNYLFTTFNYLYYSNTHLLTFNKYLSRGYDHATGADPCSALRIWVIAGSAIVLCSIGSKLKNCDYFRNGAFSHTLAYSSMSPSSSLVHIWSFNTLEMISFFNSWYWWHWFTNIYCFGDLLFFSFRQYLMHIAQGNMNLLWWVAKDDLAFLPSPSICTIMCHQKLLMLHWKLNSGLPVC